MKLIKNPFYDRFRCIADRCPDSCCKEWDVLVDADKAALYRSLPGDLGDRLRHVLMQEDGNVYMTIENGRCPMWRQDSLCRIQAELGEDALCKTCREFPRLTHDYGDFVEYTLELSCPEAARLLLTEKWAAPVLCETSGGEKPEYDRNAMDILLPTREHMYSLLSSNRSIGESLALGLMYGYQVQAELNGLQSHPFDPDAALDTARSLARPSDSSDFLSFFADLEILTNAWKRRLNTPSPTPWSEPLRSLARYGVERYWLQAVADYDLASRVKMVMISCLLVKTLGGDPVQTAQLYSKEIENNSDNVDAILDAAYNHPVFTDDKLLWLLLQK